MDIELLRTFLTVKMLRHFGRAAEELHVTPAAVSARIKRLEELFGVTLIDRQTREFELTPEGHRLVHHADLLLAEWNKAEQEVAFGDKYHQQLTLAGVYSMWDFLLQDWMQRLSKRNPRMALIAHALGEDVIQRQVLNRILDLGFLFEPPMLPELIVEEVAVTNLILVSTRKDANLDEALGEGYVMVDWGLSFAVQHSRLFPDIDVPQFRMGRGRMARAFILKRGGAAYLTERTVRKGLRDGNLFMVEDAPVIQRNMHAIYLRRSHKQEVIQKALQLFSKYKDDSVIEEIGSLAQENS